MVVNSKIFSFSTLIVFTVLAAIGFAMVPLLSIQFLPTAQTPGITVRYFWQDAAPEMLEREVTATLEGAFNLIAGVERIYSISGRNGGSIRLDLDKNADLDFLRFEIASKIRQLFPQLPQGLSYPSNFLHEPKNHYFAVILRQYKKMETKLFSKLTDRRLLHKLRGFLPTNYR